jgi:Methyltransferase domain
MPIVRTKDAELYPKRRQPLLRTSPPSHLKGFEDLFWLFSVGHHNRGIVRLDLDEAALLFKLTRGAKGASLEIGRRHGGSTLIMLAASEDRLLVSIDVDPNHYPVCQTFLTEAEQAGRLTLLKGNSREPLGNYIFNLVFIDGDHSFEGVCADIRAHWASLQPIGNVPALCVFHDVSPHELESAETSSSLEGNIGLSTVTAAVRRLIGLQCGVIHAVAGSMVAIRKTNEIPPTFPSS